MLLVQHFLESHTFQELFDQHGVEVSFDPKGYKFSLNYSQLDAKDHDILAQQCRGLILAIESGNSLSSQAKIINGRLDYMHLSPGKTKILAYPMNRFFNASQECAAIIDWNNPNLAVLEKLDGTLCIVYFDTFSQNFCVATRSVPEAHLPIDLSGFTFRTLFEKALQETLHINFETFVQKLNKNYTYCFELCTPYNRIVVRYQNSFIALLSVRDNVNEQEIILNHDDYQWLPKVKKYSLSNLEEICQFVNAQNPLENEGIVVVDNFNRIKVKNINYVLLNRTRDILINDRAFLNLVLNEKEDDVWEVLPEIFQKRVIEIKEKYHAFLQEFQKNYEFCVQNSSDAKTFAIIIKIKNLWQAPAFAFYRQKVQNFSDFLEKNKITKKSPNGDIKEFSNSFLDSFLKVLNLEMS